MTVFQAFYSAAYACADSPLYTRLAVTAEQLQQSGLVELCAPPPFDRERLVGLHDPVYLAAFDNGNEPLASSQGIRWTPGIREACYAMLAGQMASVERSLSHRISMNIARGFHHAIAARGSGFCALNGLALIAHQWPDRKVFVIDCDEHGGNGTEEFTQVLPNLYQASVFGTRFGCRGGPRSWAFHVPESHRGFDDYLNALRTVRDLLEEIRPDVLLYQAGVDCHVDDPKSRSRLSSANLQERDRYVFECARDLAIPISFSLGGGYQHAALVAELNTQTVRVATMVYSPA